MLLFGWAYCLTPLKMQAVVGLNNQSLSDAALLWLSVYSLTGTRIPLPKSYSGSSRPRH